MVLVRRDDDVSRRGEAFFVYRILMEQDAARHLHRGMPHPIARGLARRLFYETLRHDLVEQAQPLVGHLHHFHHLRGGVHERVEADGSQAQTFGGLFGLRAEQIVVQVEASERPHHVGIQAVLAELGRGLLVYVLVGAFAIIAHAVERTVAVGQDRAHIAVVERVFQVVAERHVLGRTREIGNARQKRLHGVHRGVDVGKGGLDLAAQILELAFGGKHAEATRHQRGGMRGTTRQGAPPLVAQALQAQCPRHQLALIGDHGEGAGSPRQIGCDQQVDVKHVRVEILGHLQQLAQGEGLLGDGNAQRILHGLKRDQGMAHRADAADAADHARDIGIVTPPHHGLEETRRLGHDPIALLDLAVADLHLDSTVMSLIIFYPSKFAVNMRVFEMARDWLMPPRSISTRCSEGMLASAENPRHASHGMPEAGHGAPQPARATCPMQ